MYVEINAVLCCISIKESLIISPMSLWECVLLCQVYWKWYQDTTVMLQMSLKEMSYFSYKSLSSSCPCLSTLLSWSSVAHPFTVISYLALMKEKQPLLITMTPWELATENRRVCVCVWCELVLWDIILLPLPHCVFCWVRSCSNAKVCSPVHCDGKLLWHVLVFFIYMQNIMSYIFHILVNVLLSKCTIKFSILKLLRIHGPNT